MELLGVNSHTLGPILESSPAQNHIVVQPISATPRFGPRRAQRELPFRPYLHGRIPRIKVVEQLPQIIIHITMIIVVFSVQPFRPPKVLRIQTISLRH